MSLFWLRYEVHPRVTPQRGKRLDGGCVGRADVCTDATATNDFSPFTRSYSPESL